MTNMLAELLVYDPEPARKRSGAIIMYNGKPVHDLIKPFPFSISDKHIDGGEVECQTSCQNALALQSATGRPVHVGPQTSLIELEDKYVQGWNSKPMMDVVKIQDHEGRAKPGIYILNPRPPGQERDRHRQGAAPPSEPTSIDEALKQYRNGKVTSDVVMRRRWGWGDTQIAAFKTLINETSEPTPTKTRQRYTGPLTRRSALKMD